MQMPSMHRYGHPGQNQRRENQSIRNYLSTRSGSRNRISRSPHNMASVYTRAPAIAYDDDTYDTLEESEDNGFVKTIPNEEQFDNSRGRDRTRSGRSNGHSFLGYLRDTFTERQPSGRRGSDTSRDMINASLKSRARSRRRSSSRRRHRNASMHMHFRGGSRRSATGSQNLINHDRHRRISQSSLGSSREGEYNHASRSSRVRRRHRRSSRRRGPRAGGHGDSFTSITPSGSAEHPISDIDQKRLRKNSDTSSRGTRESPIDDSFGEDNYRLVSRNRATSIYTTPSALYTRTESLKTYKRTTGDSKGTSPALASFLEHKTLSADVINHIPLLRMLESVPRSEAIREDELLYMSAKTFKYVSHWYSNSRPDYANGKMYTSPPPENALAWKRTAKQAHALILHLGRDSLRSSVMSLRELNQSNAVLFLLNSCLKIAICIHKNKMHKYGNVKILSTMPHVRKGDAQIFENSTIHTMRDPMASAARASYGSLAYWPELRCALGSENKRIVRYAIVAMLQAEIYLLTRISSQRVSMNKSELRILSSCITMECVAACIAVQFLYTSLWQILYSSKINREYIWLKTASERSKKLPMASTDLLYAEGACLGRLESSLYGTEGTPLGRTLVEAYLATRSAFTELIYEFQSNSDLFLEKQNVKLGEKLTAAVIAATVVIQRLLGHLNIIIAQMVIGSVYHKKDVDVWSETFKMYQYLSYVCKSLYRPVTIDEYINDRDDTMEYLTLEFARGDPPTGMASVIYEDEKSEELESLKLVPPPINYDILGNLVPLRNAIEDASDVIFEKRAVETARREPQRAN